MPKQFVYKAKIILVCFLYTLIFAGHCCAQNAERKVVPHGFVIKPAPYKPLPTTAQSELGKALVKKNSCLTCHSINNEGGCLSPPLDGIGAFRSKGFILARITKGAAAEREFAHLYGQPELMPHLRVPSKDAQFIAHYLLTLPAPKNGFFVAAHPINSQTQSTSPQSAEIFNDTKAINEGKKLVYEHGCTACHSIHNIGGHFAPPFDDISKHHTKSYVKARITSVEFFNQNSGDEYASRGTVMPPSNLSTEEIDKITQFLMSL